MESTMFNAPLPLLAGFVKSAKTTLFDWTAIKAFVATMIILAGNFDEVYLALAIALIADLVTGVAAAIKEDDFQVIKLRNAIGKWLAYYLLLVLAKQASCVSGYLFWMQEATAIFIFLTEYNSVAENLNKLGFPAPTFEKLVKAFRSFKRNSS